MRSPSTQSRPALLAVAFALVIAATGCGRGNRPEATSAAPPAPGSLYSLSDGEGGYRAAKVLGEDADVVFVHLFTQRWPQRPALAAARQAGQPVPIAYTTATFAGMQPVLLEPGTVTPEELAAYDAWKQGKREAF
jgi:hypothetical protein